MKKAKTTTRNERVFGMWLIFLLMTPLAMEAATTNYYYVAAAGSATSPYDTWAKAATNIQDAATKAMADFGVGTNCLVVVTNGVYQVTNAISITNGIALTSVNGFTSTVIKANFSVRCVYIASTATGALLDGFTVTNGYLAGNSGGGIYIAGAATVRNCLITGNRGSYGGGMLLFHSSAVVSNCQFIGNTAEGGGGQGAGLRIYRGLLVDCLVSNNLVLPNGRGGGIDVAWNPATIRNCRIVANTAYQGGGICATADGYNSVVQNSLIAGNYATSAGGGVYSIVDITFQNCTIVGNSAVGEGGGVSFNSAVGSGTNCIVYFNQAPAGTDIGGTVTNFRFSCSPVLTSGTGNITADPRFVLNGSGYGVSHQGGDFHLRKGSPAANTGTNLPWMGSAVDIEGYPRILDGTVNMGAYEHTIAPKGTIFFVF